MKKVSVFAILVCLFAITNIASADLVCGINIDFVTIGNAGNTADTKVRNDGTASYGAVGYEYRIGEYEITNAQWDDFVAAVGAPVGGAFSSYITGALKPANNVNWYEAVQFCNYLTTGDKSKGAYQFSGNNANPGGFLGINRTAAQAAYGTIYVLPTEDEWYKAAYYKSDGSGYSLYANGLNTILAADNGWNYTGGAYKDPWNVGAGMQEQNGTFDMMGNVWEWSEALISYDYTTYRVFCGGGAYTAGSYLASSSRSKEPPGCERHEFGFRVVSIVPEPCSIALFALGGLVLLRRKRFA